jgi:ubiquinone/menaquinone biosynthesis C-methylase UbiE
LTRENKLKTLREVKRVLKPDGEFYVADWGLPANLVMTASSRLIQLLDGFETTADNFNGFLPRMMADAGFEQIEETNHYNTLFGTIRLHSSRNT